ncbi:MAG: IS3 family transposase [Candidatus Marinimicrobia bacterium]|nr:IS3 family transposase [Candidatus Neomarinimicrobiota bacterium]
MNGKITENVLNKIKFKTILEMEATIMNYIYNYNIKHSSIGRKTPMQTLQKIWNHKNNSIKFKQRNFDEFYKLDKKLISNFKTGI